MCSKGVIRETKPTEIRKIRKPLMEKKRRARINDCLEELKNIILESKKDRLQAKPTKLEKADILELTVNYLKGILKQHENKYSSGFKDCQDRVIQLVNNCSNLDSTKKSQIVKYLNTGLSNTSKVLTLVPKRLPNGDVAFVLPLSNISNQITDRNINLTETKLSSQKIFSTVETNMWRPW